MDIKLDQTDLKILDLLQKDARMTIKEISSRLNLSTTPVFERIKKLEKREIIDRYIAVLNHRKLGKKLIGFVNISVQDHSKETVENAVKHLVRFPEVMECHYVSGSFDFILKVLVDDIEQYNLFALEKLSRVPNIGKVETLFSLSERKNSHILPLIEE